MNTEIIQWKISKDAKPKLAAINRTKYLKLMPYAIAVIAIGFFVIPAKGVSYKGAIYPILEVIASLIALYWYFGTSKFLPINCEAQFSETDANVIIDGWMFTNPKIEILEELPEDYVVLLKAKSTMATSIPKEILNKFPKTQISNTSQNQQQ